MVGNNCNISFLVLMVQIDHVKIIVCFEHMQPFANDVYLQLMNTAIGHV